ncbi:hypothetical protein NO995_04775 [Aestuariibaculum sp. M13]|uniref:hypothetical protein n=1 Tax=Aestuariibaculum sp. M13 TaxID=2967132 RepID=UPI002159DB25|nr:hypothetical protein [Aestuariibaculum sp. M13]MCR8666983.1 hypothetical protein [Aestuariibaculum sp. M13]
MSQAISIVYSFLILIQSFNINFDDFSKFNALLEHASYHKEMYGDNFLQFLSEHYGGEVATHGDKHEEHKNLPFKEHQHLLCHLNATFILTQHFSYNIKRVEIIEKPVNFFYKEPVSLFEKPSVFQPPKLA